MYVYIPIKHAYIYTYAFVYIYIQHVHLDMYLCITCNKMFGAKQCVTFLHHFPQPAASSSSASSGRRRMGLPARNHGSQVGSDRKNDQLCRQPDLYQHLSSIFKQY